MDKHETLSKLPPDVQARIDFARSVLPKRHSGWHVKVILAIAGIILTALVIWLLSGTGHSTKKVSTVKSASVAKVSVLSANPATNSYSSTYFGLSFTYPKSWQLSDDGKGLLTLTSPLVSLTADTGKKTPGYITFTIAKQGTLPSALSKGTNLAVLDSSLITYVNPSQDQSADTYISFVQYSMTNFKGGLDGIYVTGNYGYQHAQVVPDSTIIAINPLVMASFSSCITKTCKTQTPLTIASSSWSSSPLNQILSAIFASFIFN